MFLEVRKNAMTVFKKEILITLLDEMSYDINAVNLDELECLSNEDFKVVRGNVSIENQVQTILTNFILDLNNNKLIRLTEDSYTELSSPEKFESLAMDNIYPEEYFARLCMYSGLYLVMCC